MNIKKILTFALVLTMLFGVTTVTNAGMFDWLGGGSDDELVIGFSMDNLRLERWQKDKKAFVKQAEKLGAKVKVLSANSNDQKQVSQAQNLLTQGVDVLVIIPHNGKVMGSVVEEAHASGVKVLAYDRMVQNAKTDAYISYDNVKVGEMQAKAVLERQPTGKYFLLGGSPTDPNAKMFREGQMNVLEPHIENGDIEVIGDQWVKNWSPQEAMSIMENALTRIGNDIDAVVASNDSTAGGAIEALSAQGLAGDVVISGQDATVAGCNRIVKDTQAMTIYKPINKLAKQGAKMAVKLAKGKEVNTNAKVDNGQIKVPSLLLEPILVNKDNMKETIIDSGYHTMEEVYKGVPKSKWPEQE
ncbi:D-xylose ABC transporter substrate-binding protein [Halanaerobacter jeridensis]|uniref:D-xylose transport system substrate-binding protein n=1 Tax=Halanaerobacter jeridensis TaxID=706427 RepID=A0A938XST6_9FIRM|nr:D-xylose ABC transporter substrate-binding protein [Halanaerobacter jeridensis]MBM7555656.1 D-xylose transport system substrate-binding protein [Halanaerobacter jeridensis]